MNAADEKRMVGQVGLVTGAASGIGKAIAQRFAAEGARVALADLNGPEAAAIAQAICAGGGRAVAIRLDVTSEAGWELAMARVLKECGHLDTCVNCAGIAFAKAIVELDLTDWRWVIGTNLEGVFLDRKEWWNLVPDQGVFASGGNTNGTVLNLAARHQ